MTSLPTGVNFTLTNGRVGAVLITRLYAVATGDRRESSPVRHLS